MPRKSTERPPRHSVTSGEILVGLAWMLLFIALIASGLDRNSTVLLAERVPSGFF